MVSVTSNFFTGSGNTAGSRMRNASSHNYWNSSFIMDVAMGQIPRSTERISSFKLNQTANVHTKKQEVRKNRKYTITCT